MKFYSGGHIGDLVYQLCAVRRIAVATGNPAEFYIGPGQSIRWGQKEWESVLRLVGLQEYISCAKIVDACPDDAFNFMMSESHIKKNEFFELDEGKTWPANASLKKIYYFAASNEPFNIRNSQFSNENQWIKCEKTKLVNVVAHIPKHRMCRDASEWENILLQLKRNGLIVKLIGGDDVDEWSSHPSLVEMITKPRDMLEAAEYINSANVFIGSASCNYVLAESLSVMRFVDVPPESIGTVPTDTRGWNVALWSAERIIRSIMTSIEGA